jgi:hypothetical protein
MRFSVAAATLAIAVCVVALRWQSTSIGGADQYGYITEAGLIAEGGLIVHHDIVRYSPWPSAEGSWTPIGYAEVPGGPGAITPVYPPGLPLMMAIAQRLFGFCAAFAVVPICAGLTVWFTYLLGSRVFEQRAIALAGTTLLASSPIFVAQSLSPLSDVPATAGWTLALILVLSAQPIAAGLAAAVAIAIRPNLAPISIVLLAWTALATRPTERGRALALLRFGLAMAPGVVIVAWVNARVHGSPLRSGYGDLVDLYSWRYARTNLIHFSSWTAASDSPTVALAVLFLAAPLTLGARIPFSRVLFGGFAMAVMLSYAFYRPFEDWVYLRFLLPVWPILTLLTAAALAAVLKRWLPAATPRVALPAILALLLLHHGRVVARERLFERWQVERRYQDVGRFIAATTDPSAVFVSWQESGAIRVYADRLTLNFDRLDRRWLDRAIDRLRAMGRRPYFVVEGFEEEVFRRRFSGGNRFGALDWPPIAVYEWPYVAIYDPYARDAGRRPAVIPASAGTSRYCGHPAAWPPRPNFP